MEVEFFFQDTSDGENSGIFLSVANILIRASITVLAGPATELQSIPQFPKENLPLHGCLF
jgi:hypothetical protein